MQFSMRLPAFRPVRCASPSLLQTLPHSGISHRLRTSHPLDFIKSCGWGVKFMKFQALKFHTRISRKVYDVGTSSPFSRSYKTRNTSPPAPFTAEIGHTGPHRHTRARSPVPPFTRAQPCGPSRLSLSLSLTAHASVVTLHPPFNLPNA